jgi:hypothetical protein
MKSQFDGLLEEIETMAKAMPAGDASTDEGDKKIAAAAADSGVEAPAETSGEGDAEMDDENDGEGAPMAKSFSLTLEDGSKVDAVDGTELVKSMMTRMEANESVLLKALTGAMGLIKTQGDMLKALGGKVDSLAKSGVGRKAVVNIAEKSSTSIAAKPAEEGMKPEEFMTKALIAQGKGLVTGQEVCIADNRLQNGVRPDEDFIRKVLSA